MTESLTPISGKDSWDRTRARHLLNRAGFGLPYELVEHLVELGPEASVRSLVEFDALPDNYRDPDFLPLPRSFRALRLQVAGMTEEERKQLRMQLEAEEHEAVFRLQEWWLDRMRTTARPLQEKLALMWHGHFATSAQKVKNVWLNYDIYKTFLNLGAGSFRTLVTAVGTSAAMLWYLDNSQNRKGHPNENWARELMELFTMGIGNYTEDDIKEAARAFTGWTLNQGGFALQSAWHDDGEKRFLGHQGRFDGQDILNILFEQDATARFISRKVWEFFAYEAPGEELVSELARLFRAAKYEMKPLLTAIFRSEAFYSPRAIGTQIKSPVQLLLGLSEDLGVEWKQPRLARMALTGLGQDLFFPPNVKGWPGNRSWIDTNTLLIRYNLSALLVNGPEALRALRGEPLGRGRRGQGPFDAQAFLRRVPGTTVGEAVQGMAERLLGRSLAPEQQEELVAVLQKGARESDPFRREGIDESRVRSALHLILSMAEYQLC